VSTIVFVEMPAFGHVNPSLPLAHELVRRGERVIYLNDAEFSQAVSEASGAEFRPYPPGVVTSAMIARATQTGDLIRVPRVILRATETLVPFLLERLRADPPDAVVLDSNALWGHIVVRSLRLPSVSLMTTILIGSAEFRRLRLREWLRMLRPMLPSLVPIAVARSRLLRKYDASVVPRPVFPALGGLNLALFPREFQPPNSRVDATFRFVGPMIDPDTRLDAPFELSGSEPLVYMSLGTLHSASTTFYRQCLEAFADMPVRFVLTTGNQVDVRTLGTVPSNAVVSASVPQLAVLERAAVFVTHGGMNSALEGLACGVPMVVIPQHAEQLVIGLTVARRGAALVRREQVAGQTLDASVLRRDVEQVLATPSFKTSALQMQTSIRATGGFRRAADEVQAYVGAVSAA
jgi:MGT family glycosyltransferase